MASATPRPTKTLSPALAAAAALAFAAAARAQDFAYEKFLLDNGMTVILHVDRSLPVVAVNTWFRVGAKDEPPGRSGFAHLFEHLMFMGTERVPGNQFDVLMEQGGGSNNASTTEDRTNYFAQGPSSLLPTLLWLDADRLEDTGRTMTQEKLDRQRDIVRNEIRQNVENTPYGRANERVFRVLFPKGHPYHNAVYGTHEDLEAATVADVKDFFATFYVPNNASLVIAGDFDPETVKPLVRELFGTLPRGAAVSRQPVPPLQLERTVRVTMLDRVQSPMVKIVWHSPRAYADGDAEMILLGYVLAEGKSSRLYRRLVLDDRIATDVSAYQDSLSLGSLFTIDVPCVPGADLDAVERAVDEELDRLRQGGITAAELEQRKALLERRRLGRWQGIGAIADQMNLYEFVWGEPNSFVRDLDRFRTAAPERVHAFARATLDPDRRAILRVLPEEPGRKGSARDRNPGAAAAAEFAPPLPESFALGNGIPVHLWRKPGLPLVAMRVQFDVGKAAIDPAKAGLAALTTKMMLEGAGDLDAIAFADAMESLGASFGVDADHETATASLSVLRRNLDRAAELLADATCRPRFDAASWERVQKLHLDELRHADDEPNVVAHRVGMRVLFGDAHRRAWPIAGTASTVGSLALADVQAAHRSLFHPRAAMILVAGDVTATELRTVLDRTLGAWRAAPPAEAATGAAAAPAASAMRVVLVDRPGAVQTAIRFFAPGPAYGSPDRKRCQLLNTVLGGSFTSRLNQNLREKNGFTYGAGSSFAMAPTSGYFTAQTNVRSDVTGPALRELLAELRRLGAERADVTQDELDKARETLRTATVQSYGTLGGILAAASDPALNGRPFTAPRDDLAALAAAGVDEINALGPKVVQLAQGVIVLVGDKQAITTQLRALAGAGVELPAPIEVDVHGEALAR